MCFSYSETLMKHKIEYIIYNELMVIFLLMHFNCFYGLLRFQAILLRYCQLKFINSLPKEEIALGKGNLPNGKG